ncbi:hypothetical protein TSUD_376350 [Trifolium subterraneum]|uniref:ATPase AAA-type core domain-containing protein n=1 Tax=Trifolium subterraneum TaxID=3900 RepID=A0A2Z6PEZ1_TRISU|nr:hypothetical protein TSUD_376350 [Trifolium subterraneum]
MGTSSDYRSDKVVSKTEIKRTGGVRVGVGGKKKMKGTMFKDLVGNEMKKIIKELKRTVKLLYQPELIREYGMKPKRGILLHGPPGCGKTRLSHAIANEAQVPFYPISATYFVTGVTEAILICFIQSPCPSHSIDGGGHFRPIPFCLGLAEVPYYIGRLLHEVVRIGTLAVGNKPFGRPNLRNVYSTFKPAEHVYAFRVSASFRP